MSIESSTDNSRDIYTELILMYSPLIKQGDPASGAGCRSLWATFFLTVTLILMGLLPHP